MNRPPLFFRIWMRLHEESDEIGDRLVLLVCAGAALLYAVGAFA